MSDEPNCSIMSASSDFAKMNVPLPCEKEPIHIINRVQPCGCLIVVDSSLKIVQCSTNAVELLSSSPSNGESMSPPSKRPRSDPSVELDKIIGSHLSLLLDENAVEQVKTNAQAAPGMSNYETEAVRNFLIRSKGMFHQENASCCVIQSGDHFILEIEKIPPSETESQGGKFRDRNTMLFMEETAKELRKCWSIEEMASLVCSKIMGETPYDRGMVYRFDHDDSGEIIYESFRHDARSACKKDSFLGLRFPASDIPRQARELFMKNTLRFVYDVDGEDHALYPSKVTNSAGMSTYTDLSLCRIRGSSFVHLKYLKNMAVTSSMVIAIIVNKKLWGLYTFHGYREPLVPTPRTRFICEMASIVTSMIMESLTKMADHERLMEIDKMTQRLNSMKILAFMEENHEAVKEAMDVNLISFRYHDPHVIKTYGPKNSGREVKTEVFDHLNDCYGNVCKDYGVVFIDDQKNHEILAKNNLYTLAYFTFPALDLLLSRNHLKKGKPWCTVDKTMVKRFVDQIEKNSSNEISKEHAETIQALQYERNQAIDDAKVNFDFFAHMAHELRTPFHGILGSLEAMREDPKLADHELLKMAYMCGESMIKILDDILLLAKGSYTMQLEEQSVDIHAFLMQTLADMNSYARMEGQSIRIRKEDTVVTQVAADFSRVRQIINNLISNAIKFSENDIFVEVLQRKSFSDVVSVWKTYTTSYPNVDQSLSDVENLTNDPQGNKSESDDTIWTIFSVVDNGIGISKDDLKLLGTAFTQLSTGRQKRYQGTGLGISICNLLITALRGKLVVFSAPGFGSCFTFAIPVKKDPEPTKPTATKEQKNTIGNTERKLQLKQQFDSLGLQHLGLKILVVDDSKLNRKLCGRKINTWLPDINVTECVSGVEALEEYKYDHGSIFGIFMDFHMPGMDGDRCTREIRAYENTNGDVGHAYIAGFTADVLEDSTKTLIAAGMDSEFQSPSLPMHLKQTCLA